MIDLYVVCGVPLHRTDAQRAQHPSGQLVEVAVVGFWEALEELERTGKQPGGLQVRSATLFGLGSDDIEARGTLRESSQVEMLRDECRLGAPISHRLRNAGVGLAPHVENLSLVGGVAQQGVTEAVDVGVRVD